MKTVCNRCVSLFSTDLSKGGHVAALVLRLLVGGMMLTHGLPKVLHFSEISGEFPDPIGLGPATSLALVAFAEAGCSFLLILGLGTRLATIPLAFAMIVASFFTFPEFAFPQSELSIFYLGAYVTLFLLGSGKYSLDRLIHCCRPDSRKD